MSNVWSIETGYACISLSLSLCVPVSPSLPTLPLPLFLGSHTSQMFFAAGITVVMVMHQTGGGGGGVSGWYIITFVRHTTHNVHAGAECSHIYPNCCAPLRHCEVFCNIEHYVILKIWNSSISHGSICQQTLINLHQCCIKKTKNEKIWVKSPVTSAFKCIQFIWIYTKFSV